ncbi:serine/threonine-protein kinase [Pseudofrankia asymbiotica]|uniref:Serine/threonine protein kinase n=1 Tax=Pseudofrankia asymbiotica TaxID=1834516 RepID=A0A1V2IEI9_9ACTN|nr:serine/threonine-protein kinase [Pseudofrankia asymbiotica]ONH31622.1 serine/threonine protein kinase [Pseudofrankia asymbiotica]
MSSNGGIRKALRANDPTAIGPYRLSARLGSGGMGTVYLGSDPSGRQAAVKMLRDDHGGGQALRRRFAREVVAVAAIDSPRVARLLDADPLDEQPWLATEYVPGPTLTASVLADGSMSGDRLRTLAVGVAEALCAVHEIGVVHRDLKPSNIMLADDGPKIIDFGIVAGLPETVTASGIVLGSLGYIAPELLVDGGRPSSKADIFSWALTLVFASTGRAPFGNGPVEALLYRTVNTIPDLRAIPGGLRGLAVAALDKNPQRRPTAKELLTQLQGSPAALAPRARALGAPPADAPTTDFIARSATALAAPAALDAAMDDARDDQAVDSLPTDAFDPTDLPGTRASRRHASQHAPVTALRKPRRRVLLPAAGMAAALAVTASALVAAAPENPSGVSNAQRPTLPASGPPASTEPTTLAPATTAPPGAAGTGPAAQPIAEPAAPRQPPATLDSPSSEPSPDDKPRTSAVGESKSTGPTAPKTKPHRPSQAPAQRAKPPRS